MFLLQLTEAAAAASQRLLGKLVKTATAIFFTFDDFFLRPDQRTHERLSQVGGNVDFERFKTDVLDKILLSAEFEYRPYNCITLDFKDPVVITPKQINIVEGSYASTHISEASGILRFLSRPI